MAAAEMRSEIVRVQMLDQLIADHGVVGHIGREAFKVNAIGHTPLEALALSSRSASVVGDVCRLNLVAERRERARESPITGADLVDLLRGRPE
jgi:hypothetical protein